MLLGYQITKKTAIKLHYRIQHNIITNTKRLKAASNQSDLFRLVDQHPGHPNYHIGYLCF